MLNSQDGPGHGECDVFLAPDGSVKEVLCYDYGFRSGFGRLYQGGDGEIPKGFFALARPTAVFSWEEMLSCPVHLLRNVFVYLFGCAPVSACGTFKSL